MATEALKLRVWHIPDVPGLPFQQDVSSIEEAKLVLKTLARYDLYLGDRISSNAQGLEVFEDGEWVEFSDDDGNEIRDLSTNDPFEQPPRRF